MCVLPGCCARCGTAALAYIAPEPVPGCRTELLPPQRWLKEQRHQMFMSAFFAALNLKTAKCSSSTHSRCCSAARGYTARTESSSWASKPSSIPSRPPSWSWTVSLWSQSPPPRWRQELKGETDISGTWEKEEKLKIYRHWKEPWVGFWYLIWAQLYRYSGLQIIKCVVFLMQ